SPYGRAFQGNYADVEYDVRTYFDPEAVPDDPARWAEFSPVRTWITTVGAESEWDSVPVPAHRQSVPFDEPALGIVGMWRQGARADPHRALALGETRLRVGQRYIAWCAFERAARLADRFWPEPAMQQFLREHCGKRQAEIEQSLLAKPGSSDGAPA